MISHHSSLSASNPHIDPYSDELPPINAQPLLSLTRQSPFYNIDTSQQQPASVSCSHSPSLSSMSCAASFRSSSFSSSEFPQPSAVASSAFLRSSQSVDSLQLTCKSSSSAANLSSHQHQLVRDWQLEERKEAPVEYEHKEQQPHHQQHLQQTRQHRIRDVSRTRHQPQRRQRERSTE